MFIFCLNMNEIKRMKLKHSKFNCTQKSAKPRTRHAQAISKGKEFAQASVRCCFYTHQSKDWGILGLFKVSYASKEVIPTIGIFNKVT